MKGQIIKISSNIHLVSCNNETFPCICRGIFRKEHITPVVGDYVLFNKDKLLIEKVLPRKNIFKRPKVSNIDQAFIVTSLKDPDLSLNLLDKFISIMEINKVEPIICITKQDLVDKDKLLYFENILSYYRSIGYKVVYNNDLDTIKSLLSNKTTVFTGQTGAGKSTLLNKLSPNISQETNEISKSLGRGKHTTRTVEMFNLFGGKVMDTPGFSSLDLDKYPDSTIKDSFIEFKKYKCPYKDCSHTNEEECSVKVAVKKGKILESRYLNYIYFIKGGTNENKRIILKQ